MLRQNQWRDMNDINSQNILKQKLIDNEEDLNLRVALSNRTERMRQSLPVFGPLMPKLIELLYYFRPQPKRPCQKLPLDEWARAWRKSLEILELPRATGKPLSHHCASLCVWCILTSAPRS